MKKRYILPLFMMVFLSLSAVPAYAETGTIRNESVTLTEEERYKEEYYGEPVLRFPEGQIRLRANGKAAGKTLEQHVVEAIENFEPTIDVSAYNVPKDKASEEYFKILNNNPQLFYVQGLYSGTFYEGENTIFQYKVTYIDTKENILPMREEFEAAANEAAAQVDRSLDDYQQALIVHDYLTLNCEYDKENLDNNDVPDISHTAYGSLVNQIAVCDGYADAFSYIMEDKLGIPCEVVSSDAMAHAWNMIEIGGKWYHTDVTWDDPTWDLIGRSGHSYFLLSDSKISDNEHRHHSWSGTRTASSTDYDDAFWANVSSAICYYNGSWYYSRFQRNANESPENTVKLVKRSNDSMLDGSDSIVYEASAWTALNGYYTSSYMYLTKAYDELYFNTKDKIYKLDNNDTVSDVYSPDLSAKYIYGFTVRGNELWYGLQNTPTLSAKQVIHKHALAQVTGITASDVTGVYNGQPHTITVLGMQAGDVVQYADDNGNYQTEQPEMINAGTYEVLYKVDRNGYLSFHGSASVTIEPAVPQYVIPTGLTGEAGGILADIALPAGFRWQEPDTKLTEMGRHVYLAEYEPEDRNYKAVSDIEISLEVVCTEHDYISEITIQPGPGQDGEERLTCKYCGDTYTRKIDGSAPVVTGVTAEDVTGVYNGTPYTIQVTGTEEGDTIQYALEGEGYGNEQPEMINAGTYEVLYKVSRDGYQPYLGSVVVEISRAVPTYTVPTGLVGYSGSTLSSIELPDGFIWQADDDTKLSETGNQKFTVCYIPRDQVNYQPLMNIEIVIEVRCPGHQYESVITRKATETQKGERKSICKLCGKSFTEEIPMLTPARPGSAVGLTVSKNTTNSLSFSWKKTVGVSYRLMLYKGNSVISTKYVGGNTYTYKKLGSATTYTLRVLPYREVNGQKVYARTTMSVKTATAPAKAKLSSAKKSGKNKVKLVWKKVAGASGYEISMKTGNGKYKNIKTIGKGSTVTFTKTKLSRNKTYSFRIRAYTKVDGKRIPGAYSNVKKVKIK